VIDITDPTSPKEVENLAYETPGFASDIAVNSTSDIAILADGSGGLTILNMAQPAKVDQIYPASSSSDLGNCFISSTGSVLKHLSNLWILLMLLLAATWAYIYNKHRE
jgi:hypothetical protein